MKDAGIAINEREATLAVSPVALYAVAVLFAINMVGYLDRQIIGLPVL